MIHTAFDLFESYEPNYSLSPEDIFVDESYDFISYALNLCREHTSATYYLASTLVAENTNVLNEMFEDSTFVAVIKSIINCFLEAIRNLVDRFIYFFTRFTSDKAQIEKYGQKILGYDKNVAIPDFVHFRYTNLDTDIPPASLNMRFLKEYNEMMDKLTNIGRENDIKKLVHDMIKFSEEVKKDIRGEYMMKFRGEVLGINEDISEARFSEELIKIYRDGRTQGTTLDVTPGEIEESYRRFKNSKIMIDSVKKLDKDIRKSAEDVKKNVRNVTVSMVTGGKHNGGYELENALNIILQCKCEQLTKMCNTITLALGAKLDAIKEALVADKKILHYVTLQILKGGN